MKIYYKRFILSAMILVVAIVSGISANAQQEALSDTVRKSVDTLNAKIENVKSDLDFLKRLKITGYIQAQWQLADTAGQLSPFSGGNFPKYADNRFMIRRGRLKVTYDGKLSQFVLQIDATQNGVTLKDAYVNFKDPWLQMFQLQAGVFNRPFGFEIAYSSSSREAPERARITQTLFPGERDLGAMLTIQPRKESRFNWIRANLALISGNAVAPEIDSRKDFVGQIGINKITPNQKFKYAIGVSYYNGGYFQETKKVWTMQTLSDGMTKGFVVDSTDSNKGKYAKREYYGADAQFSLDWLIGVTTLRSEYLFGTQPGTSSSNVSPNNRTIPNPGTSDTYVRNFTGGYVYFIQNILQSRHEIVVKYDWLDPNTKISGTEIASKVNTLTTKLGAADINYTTWGFGYNVRLNPNTKLMAYYEIVKNENTGTSGYTKDAKDNVFTLRVQFKF
jgi:outer membrane murein-binding lipoprotein Lpp